MEKIPEDIKSLEEKIKVLKHKEQQSRQSSKESEYAYATKVGFRVGAELVSGVIVGAALGWVLDRFLDTRPAFLIAFLLLGGAAGFLNIYKFVKSRENTSE